MSSSAKFFHFDNKPSKPSWANTNKEDAYSDWLTEKLDSGLFQEYGRQDPTEPLEGKDFDESEPSEPYDPAKHTHPILAIAGSMGSAAKAVDNGVKSLSSTSPQNGASAKPVIYSDWSPASRLFGMNQETAFSEHLVNTAHQREVADLKAAGLNPVLGVSGSGASSVSGNAGVGSSSATKVADNGFLDVLGATAAVITAVATKNPMYGYMVSNIFKAFD